MTLMKLINQIKVHPYLFTGMVGLPVIVQSSGLVIALLLSPKTGAATVVTDIPDYAYTAAFCFLLVLTAITGLIVSSVLCLVMEHWKRFGLSVYSAWFVIMWNIVFGYLSFFTFAMGLGALPAPTSMQKFLERFGMVIIQFPIAIGISIVVCLVITAVVIGVHKPVEDHVE